MRYRLFCGSAERALRSTRASGVMVAALAVGCATLAAACGGASNATAPSPPPAPVQPPIPPTIPDGLSPALTSMLRDLAVYVSQALEINQGNLPRNPQNASQLQAKITMLQNPSLAVDIVNSRRWVEGQVRSSDGEIRPVVLVFPTEGMRGEADLVVRNLEPVVPLLEQFFDVPFTFPVIRVWYGFVVGNSGGGGVIYAEDRTTYESRTTSSRLPYDAVLGHELGHSYIGNEGLTQFLELYTYNRVRGASTDPDTWSYTRSWVPGASSNQDVAALLDVYQAIGHIAMARGYRAMYPLRPPYGRPLADDVIEAFLAEVPPLLRAQVAAKLARVTF
jgi:hypothetical protein